MIKSHHQLSRLKWALCFFQSHLPAKVASPLATHTCDPPHTHTNVCDGPNAHKQADLANVKKRAKQSTLHKFIDASFHKARFWRIFRATTHKHTWKEPHSEAQSTHRTTSVAQCISFLPLFSVVFFIFTTHKICHAQLHARI